MVKAGIDGAKRRGERERAREMVSKKGKRERGRNRRITKERTMLVARVVFEIR